MPLSEKERLSEATKKQQHSGKWFDEVGGTEEKLEVGTFQDKKITQHYRVNADCIMIKGVDGKWRYEVPDSELKVTFDEA